MVTRCGCRNTHLILVLVLVLVCLTVSLESSETRPSSFKTSDSHQSINMAPPVGQLMMMMMMNPLDVQAKPTRINEQHNHSNGYLHHMEPHMFARNQEDVQPLKFQKIMNPKKPHKYPTRLLMRPYDIDFSTKNIIRLRKPLKKHFYIIKNDKYDTEEHSNPTSRPQMKLIRTQHNVSATTQPGDARDELDKFEGSNQGPQFVGNAQKFKYTTVLPLSLTTEEFMELISSAHSPVRLFNALRSSNPTAIKSKPSNESSIKREEPPPTPDANSSSLHYINSMNAMSSPLVNVTMLNNQTIPDSSAVSNAITILDDDHRQHRPQSYSSGGLNNSTSEPQKELPQPVTTNSSTIVSMTRNETAHQVSTVKTGSSIETQDESKPNASSYASAEILFDDEDDQLLDPDFTTQLTPKRGSLTSDKNKPVSLIRYPSHRRTTPRPSPSMLVMSSHRLKPKPYHHHTLQPQYIHSQHSARPHQPMRAQQLPRRYPTTRSPQQSLISGFHEATPPRHQQASPAYSVKLISKQKHKYDDKILSPTLTVVDNDAIRLPPNTTSVHNNKLIVAMRPGRRRRPATSTTQFPVYNIVAGITPPYLANPTVQPIRPWNAGPGSVYGLLKPNASSSNGNSGSGDSESSSSFGASHIKFPAAEPSYLRPEVADPIPSKFNFTLSHLGPSGIDPNRLPDKIILDANEQYLHPPDVVVTSNSTIVARPSEADTTTNQEGLMKLKTTRRPLKGNGYQTTPRVSIISANTTIVAGDSEQLHDVMSNVIAGSHHNSHFTSANHHNNAQRPTDTRPSLFSYIAGMFNNGITTTILGVLTLMKTVFVALLVMFLPPMALATAIMQVINLG